MAIKYKLPKLLSVAEYAAKWNRSPVTILRYCREGILEEAQYVGNLMWVIPEKAVPQVGPPGLDLALLNELDPNTDPLTGREKMPRAYSKPSKGGPRSFKLPGLRRERQEAGYSQRELAKVSGVNRQAILRAERGEGVLGRNARALAQALKLEPIWLMKKDV